MPQQPFEAALQTLLDEHADACEAYGRAAQAYQAGQVDATTLETAAQRAESARQKIVALATSVEAQGAGK